MAKPHILRYEAAIPHQEWTFRQKKGSKSCSAHRFFRSRPSGRCRKVKLQITRLPASTLLFEWSMNGRVLKQSFPRFFKAIFGIAFAREVTPEVTDNESKLMEYVRQNGGEFAYTIGRACPTCLRGAIATRDIKANEVLLSIPVKLGIPLPRLGWHGFAGEYASELIRLFKLDADYAARHQLHWSTQPPPGDMLTPELFTDAQLEALQTPRLAELLRYQRSVCEETYRGNLSWATFDPVSEMLKDVGGMTLDEFKHWASIVGTRDFGLSDAAHAHADPRDAHSMSTMKVLNPEVKAEELPKTALFLLPVADMVNHQDNANAERYDNGSHIMMKAKVDIKAGEAVTNNYQPNVLHRNDMSLYIYGFVQSENDLNVLSIDLPTWNRERTFDATKPDDSTFYGPQGQFNTPAELERLTALLDEMPTTQEKDEALLARGGFASWQDETIVRFRLGRKKALTNAIRLIKEALRNAGIEEREGKAWHDDL